MGLAVAEIVAGAFGRTATPVIAVGEAFIDVVPGWLKDMAVDWFGTNDKAVLLIGMAVVLVVLSGAIGVLTARRYAAGMAAGTILLVIAGIAVLSRPDTTTADLVPTVAAGVVALPVLGWLVRLAGAGAATGVPEAGTAGGSGTRRRFLTGATAVAALAVAGGGVGRWLGARRAGVEASREDLAGSIDLPTVNVPAGVAVDVTGTDPWRTPNSEFYRIDTALSVPLVRAEDWRLRVHGMVSKDVAIDFQQLLEMGLVDRWVTLTCVSNEVGGGLVGNAYWTGVPIADLLALAGPSGDADAVLSTSDDGWTAGTPLDVLTDGRDALLAVAMNGKPLPIEHGFPVRMVVPGLYGYVSATKWVTDIEVTRFDRFKAYWSTRGWSERGPVKVSSRIDVPRSGANVSAGRVAVAGVAWAQHRGIRAVDVRVDEGAWSAARLAAVPSADTWRQWVWEWDASAGRHTLEVRAITADGETQTGGHAPPAPDGATGWHRVEVSVT